MKTLGLHVGGDLNHLVPELIPEPAPDFPGKNVTLLGSFKIWDRIKECRREFTNLGINVLAPQGENITHYANGFEILDVDAAKIELIEERAGQKLTDKEKATALETLFLGAISVSDACYVVGAPREELDDGKYIGETVAGEIGWGMAHGVPIYGNKISPTLDEREGVGSFFWTYISFLQVATPQEVAQLLDEGKATRSIEPPARRTL